MRIIDADSLLKHAGIFEVKARARGCGNSILNLAKAWLWNEVNIAPTIDAVPVVRCRECKHPGFCGDATNLEAMGFYGYCSRGERKEGADNG